MRGCTMNGCDKAHYGRGYCRYHYLRWYEYGDPNGQPRETAAEYINNAVLPYSSDECLIWPFLKNKSGYGYARYGGRMRVVSRVVCEHVHGKPPTPEHEAAHSCNNGKLGCVNPRHVSWKTPKQNNADKIVHGTLPRGEKHARSKLSEEDVRTIRSLKGHLVQRELADRFGVRQTTISMIQTDTTWRHLSPCSLPEEPR